MRGLIFLPFWADEILYNNKTWEIRNKNCKIREKIYILKSKTQEICGECEIIDSFLLTKELFENNFDKHHINCTFEELPSNYKYVWVLSNIKKYDTITKYKHKLGAQTWLTLE